MNSLKPQMDLLEQVIDMAHSPAALAGDTVHFWFDDTTFKLEKGSEPKMHGGFTLVNSVADALTLQCYESESLTAFGHELTMEQWRAINQLKVCYDNLLFTIPSAAWNLAYPLVSRIREELDRQDRKFVFLCGHDSNLASITTALGIEMPETEQAIEINTPIGSKLVFEKWTDGNDDYVAVNRVYQSLDQLHHRTLLSFSEMPMVTPVTFNGLTPNADGLYLLSDIDARMAETMAKYETLEDLPNTVQPTLYSKEEQEPTRIYNLQGQRLNTVPQSGVYIQGREKKVAR